MIYVLTLYVSLYPALTYEYKTYEQCVHHGNQILEIRQKTLGWIKTTFDCRRQEWQK